MMLVAAAAMGFTACSKDATEDFEPVAQATETITISTDITRTTLNADRTQLTWVAGDQFAVYTDQGTKNTPVTYTEGAVNFDLEVAAGSQTVYAYYPYFDGQKTDQYDQTFVSMYVTSTQKQKEAGVFDGNTNDYVMVAKGAIDADKHVALTFKPVACALAFNIYGGQAGENVESVTFDPGVVCAGQHYMDITVDNPVYTAADGKATSVTVTLGNPFEAVGEKPADPNANQVYAVVARKAYEGATFTVKTSLNTYTFKTASTLDLTTDFFTMNLNLAKGETPAPPAEDEVFVKISSMDDLTDGDYVITGVYNGTYYALPVPSASSAKISGAEITVTDDQIASKDAVGKVWTIEKTGEFYSLYSGSIYLYHSNGGTKGTDLATGTSQTYPWKITYNSKVSTFAFAAVAGTIAKDRGLLFSTGLIKFGGYALSNIDNSAYCGLTLFKKIKTDPNEKKFTIDSFNATLNSEKTEISFTGTYTSTYEVEPQWSLTVSKDGSEIGSSDVIGVDGEIAADNYTVTEDGKYTFTLTATIDGQTVATKAVEVAVESNVNELILEEDFSSVTAGNNTSSNGSSSKWEGNTNFPSYKNTYQAGQAIRMGTGSATGSITSKSLDLSKPFTVTVQVKGWTTVEGTLIVTVGAQKKTITYTETLSDAFGTYSVDFEAETNASTITIATSAKRAFIDDVKVAYK